MGWLGLYSKKFGFYLVESSLKKSLAWIDLHVEGLDGEGERLGVDSQSRTVIGEHELHQQQ